MNQFFLQLIAENALDLRGAGTHYPARLIGTVIDQPPCNLAALLIHRSYVDRAAAVVGEVPTLKTQLVVDDASSLATPGGITEAGLTHLESTAAIEAWNGAADAALGKLEKRR